MKTINKIIASFFIFIVKIYQHLLSPYLGASKCRYTPTCSQYTIDAFKKHNVYKAINLSVKRIVSCRPGGGHGWDPVP